MSHYQPMTRYATLWGSGLVLLCGACDGLPYTWRTVTIEETTFQIRRNPITGVSDVWLESEVPGPNFQSGRVRLKLQLKCEGSGVLVRFRDLEVLSGPPIAPEDDSSDDYARAKGWVVTGESDLGILEAEGWMTLLKCRD